LNGDDCGYCRLKEKAGRPDRKRRFSKKRLAIVALILAVLLPGTAYALTALGSQVLPKPPSVHASILFSCPTPSLVNVTDPNPLRTGFGSGNNGTAVFGCSLSNGTVSSAFQVVTGGTVSASLNLPANVSLYLVPNSSTLGPLSQAQCQASANPLIAGQSMTLATGSYSYCESFADAGNLVSVTASWFQV
jgi:hypothetical protein